MDQQQPVYPWMSIAISELYSYILCLALFVNRGPQVYKPRDYYVLIKVLETFLVFF